MQAKSDTEKWPEVLISLMHGCSEKLGPDAQRVIREAFQSGGQSALEDKHWVLSGPKYDLIYVNWIDSCGTVSDEWEFIETVTHNLEIIHSVGWLIHEDEDILTITPHIGDPEATGQTPIGGHMTIPICSIRRRIILAARISPANR